MLTISQVFSTIAFSIESLNGLNASSAMLAFLVGTALNFIVIIPYFLTCKKYGWNSLLNLSFKRLGKASYVVVFLILCIFLCVSCSTVVVFEDFISSSVLKESSPIIIIALLIFASVYGVFLGIEALGRFANIVFVLLSASILVILLSTLEDIEYANFGTISLSNASKIFETALKGISSNTGLLSVAILVPFVNKEHKKAFTIYNAFSLVIVEMIAFSVTGVLGGYAQNKEYPYYSTATVAEFSIFKRLDIVYMCVWIFVAFIKTTYYLLLSKNLLDTILHKSAKKYSLIFCTFIIFSVSLAASYNPIIYEYIKKLIFSGISTVIVLLLPLVILVTGGKRHASN